MTINDRVESRGQHPLPAVVEKAIRSLESWTDARPNAGWQVDQHKEFPNSTVFFIDVPCEHRSIKLVYKVMAHDETWFQRNIPVVNIAVRDLDREGLRGGPILAVEESQDTVVTLFIPGDPLRLPPWTDRRLSEHSRRTFRDIGRGSKILESVTKPFSDEAVCRDIWVAFQHRLRQAQFRRGFSEELEEFARDRFLFATGQPNPVVMAHIELARNNIVSDGNKTGFIDLNFAPALSGYTITKMLHRLQFSSRFPHRASREAMDAILEGYGAERLSHGMQFYRVDRTVRGLPPSVWRTHVSPRRRRAIRVLKAMIAER